jgi:RimJ/RimL family protein N-acetyltransferase
MRLVMPECTIRPFAPEDAGALARHGNDRAIWRMLRDAFPHPYTLGDAERWLAMAAARAESDGVPFAFAIDVHGEAVGGIALKPGTDIERMSAEVGYWLGRAYWGRGITTQALRAVTAHAFETLDLVRVFALPFTHNAASVRVLERAGYVREGVLRSSAIKDGVIVDQFVYAAIRGEWMAGVR